MPPESAQSGDPKAVLVEKLKLAQGFLSGTKLSQELGMSRQTLRTHLAALRNKGYRIRAVPRRGYLLEYAPDKLYPWEIAPFLPRFSATQQYHYSEDTDSTQNTLIALGIAGAGEGTLVAAEEQTKGRGRLGRTWLSRHGGLYFSLLLRPDFLPLARASQLSLMLGCACIRGIRTATGIQCESKWPNDLFLSGKKVGGILSEAAAEADSIQFLAAGIGLNVNIPHRELPREATSLAKEYGRDCSRSRLLRHIIREIHAWYSILRTDGFEPIRACWEEHCFLWGTRVKITLPHTVREGTAHGIDKQGFFLLRTDQGLIESYSAGDITSVRY
ncbi:MAG: biotin--[acetyl-CoA-carboxylase] ligase [Candidatus Omnitrophica bacterium]|nr:biotin--[acetyl-CoA-carboxylase] ligase [Candidatus Omnitrophota bacterium]